MRTLPWDRAGAIRHVRRDIWRYVTAAARTDDDVVLMAATLLQMPAHDVRALARIQFVTSDAVGRLLDGMPVLTRRLSTASAHELEVSGRIRGPVRWGETFSRRAASGDATLLVTAPARRVFDTAENRVLRFVLDEIVRQAHDTGWHARTRGGLARMVTQRASEATRWLQLAALQDVSRAAPSPRDVARVRTGRERRRYADVLEAHAIHRAFVQRLDRAAVRAAVEEHALVTSDTSKLLELRCAFDTIASLRALGWEAPPAGLLKPPLIFSGRRGEETADVYFQSVPAALSAGSAYRRFQEDHGFERIGSVRPDLAICRRSAGACRWLLVEAKSGGQRVDQLARAAGRDLLMYRQAFDAVLARQHGPYGIGYAWGEALDPHAAGDVVLCTPDTLTAALAGPLG